MGDILKIIISAPSGAGKTTLWKKLVADDPQIYVSVSCTTRPRREGEVDGKDYYFISRDEFLSMIQEGRLLEWAEVHGYYYGTPAENVDRALEEGKDILFEVDVQGARSIKEKLPDAVTIFVLPPGVGELRQRLERRGQDSPDEIEKRLTHAVEEIQAAKEFDYIVYNEDLERAAEDLRSIVRAERLKTLRNEALISRVLRNQ